MSYVFICPKSKNLIKFKAMNDNKYDELESVVQRESQDIISYFERFMGNGEQDELREQVEKFWRNWDFSRIIAHGSLLKIGQKFMKVRAWVV